MSPDASASSKRATEIQDSDQVRSIGLASFPVGNREELVHSEYTGVTQVMPTVDVDILASCQRFLTLAEHATEIGRATGLPPDQHPVIQAQLVHLAGLGLLAPLRGIIDRCRAAAVAAAAPPRISAFGVLTRNRPESLERCLSGYVENAASHSRSLRFIILDDSKDPGPRQLALASAARLKARYGAEICYAGPEEKARYAEALGRAVGLPEVVDFALGDPEGCGHTTGANRNALLLETLGEMFLSADDDTVCRISPPPDPDDQTVTFSAGEEPSETWHYADRDAALQAARFAPVDLAALHEEFLGKNLSACLVESARKGAVNLDAIDGRFFRLLLKGTGSVRVSQCGLVGDSAVGSSAWLLSHRGPSLQRILASEAAYRTAVSSREVLRSARSSTISNQPFLMTYNVGFDHRDLLPPFMPVMRFQDGLFALVMRQCFDRSLTAHLPRAVLHDPPEARAFSPEDVWKEPAHLFTHDLISVGLGSIELGPAKSHGAERLRALGRYLAELGSLPRADFEEFARKFSWVQSAQMLEALDREATERQATAPFWADDLRKSLDQLRLALPRADYLVPKDLIGKRSEEEARALGQRLMLRFGRLMEAWPAVVEAARELRAKGQSPARAV